MRLPPKKRPGNPILASDWNALIDAMIARTPRPGSGMELVSTSGGFTYRVRLTAGGDSPPPPPLTLVGGSANNKVRVVPGYVNGVMPTLDATALNAEEPPEITLTAAETHVWIKCVAVFESASTYTIETSTSSSPPAGAEISGTGYTSFHWIGRCDVEGSGSDAVVTISNSQGGNLGVDSFGNINLWWRQ